MATLQERITALAEHIAEDMNGIFEGPTYTGDLNSAPLGWISFVDTAVDNDPAFGNGILETLKNEDDSVRVQLCFSLTGTYAVRYRLGGSWGSWFFFYAGHEAWADITGKPSTFAPTAHAHAAGDITTGTMAAARLPSNIMFGQRNGVATATVADVLTEAQFTAIGSKDANTIYFRTA